MIKITVSHDWATTFLEFWDGARRIKICCSGDTVASDWHRMLLGEHTGILEARYDYANGPRVLTSRDGNTLLVTVFNVETKLVARYDLEETRPLAPKVSTAIMDLQSAEVDAASWYNVIQDARQAYLKAKAQMRQPIVLE